MIRTRLLVAALALATSIAYAGSSHVGAAAGTPLRVMTYNTQYGHEGLDGLAATIRDAAPDIVGLQEVDVHWAERSGFADQATILGDRLHMAVRFAGIYRLPGATPSAPPREFGVALLSKFPIVAFKNDTLTRLSTQQENPVPAPAPGFLDARVDVGGTIVRVFNTHLDYRSDPRVRQQQVREMLQYIDAPGSANMPTLLFGDMNAGPTAPELGPLFQRLHDSWLPSNGPGLTYPSDNPRERIDYVFTSPHFQVRSARVPVTQASDHRPVVVDLILQR